MLLWTGEKNWPIADRRFPCNDTRNNCGTDFGSSSLHVSKVANDASMLRALGEQVTTMFEQDATILRARCDQITSTMQACHTHKHSASILQTHCENITSVIRACNEHEASMLPSWHKNTNTMRACYERANKGDARRNCLKFIKARVTGADPRFFIEGGSPLRNYHFSYHF